MKLSLVLVPLLLGGCTFVFGGRPEACGTYPEGGGPAVITTRDQELCDVVRLRVLAHLDRLKGLTRARISTLIDKTMTWENTSTLERLMPQIRKDAGDAMADDVQRAVTDVLERSSRPLSPECEGTERCLVKGVTRGVRIALMYAEPTPDAPAQAPEKP